MCVNVYANFLLYEIYRQTDTHTHLHYMNGYASFPELYEIYRKKIHTRTCITDTFHTSCLCVRIKGTIVADDCSEFVRIVACCTVNARPRSNVRLEFARCARGACIAGARIASITLAARAASSRVRVGSTLHALISCFGGRVCSGSAI